MSFERWSKCFSVQIVLNFLFCAGVGLVYLTLNAHTDPFWRTVYFFYVPAMLLARFTTIPAVRNFSSLIAISVVVLGGIVSPMPIEVIEEGFILIPLLFLMLYPGTFVAMLCVSALLLPYWFGLGNETLADFVEDCLELIVINLFASIMVYYQQRFYQQMLGYREDSRTDYLTQLENRLSYTTTLKEVARLPEEERRCYALLLIDIDDFKRINDMLGHSYGDLLLREFSRRLELIEEGRPFRIGGDEFAVLLEECNSESSAKKLAEHIQIEASKSYNLLDRVVNISVSMGIARFSRAVSTYEHLVRDADLALYHAKGQGKNSFVFFEQAMFDARKHMDRIACDLGQAVNEKQFCLVFQPKVDMCDGRIVGAEALIRWKHPELGFIRPDQFVPVAESTRQIIPIGQWVFEATCRQISRWKSQGIELPISINVSAVQLEHDNILEIIKRMIAKYEISPEFIEIEITETSIMDNVEGIIPVLEEIRAAGINISVDDFGVAYSSLNQLVRLPVNVLKIDKSFVDYCHSGKRDRMLIRAIIQLARNLDMSLVAEGVESADQADVLLLEGCQVAQGYLFYKPLEQDDFTKILCEGKSGGKF